MAVKTNAEIKSQIDTIIKVNGNREITPPKHNSILTNVIDSYLNKLDGGELDALLSYSYNPTFDSDYQIVHKKYVDDAIAGLVTGLTYQGTWDANTNTPALASGVGTNGYYYIVNVAGTTNLDGVNDWQVGDWVLFNGSAWQKIDQSTDWTEGYPTYDLRYLQLTGGTLSGSITSTSFVKSGGLATEFLKADGSVDTNTYASASDLTSYAKLDGTNSPFTGDVTFNEDIVINTQGSALRQFRFQNGATILAGANVFGSEYSHGCRLANYNIFSTGSIRLRRQDAVGNWVNTPFVFDLTNSVFTASGAAGAKNGIITDGSIKISNNSQPAAAAGAGSIRYNSGVEYSDGSTWNSLGGGGTTILAATENIVEASWSGNTDYEYSVTVTGAQIGDFCLVMPDEDVLNEINIQSVDWKGYAYCTAINTVTVICRVSSFITIPASSVFKVKVIQ